ncbi:MAG TPA: YaeQ family protein [Aquabacterium sp.]|uniref:YaeQ family protein n=1 Tax=Aquabacterium sp. TaxID=1872578 RepID=UPI002E2F196D|nr:YaeQ family protein [Aquabacterium sp.]HEX5373739.1 YaeQ family protein [Aquabacterium sp.]
MAIKATIYKAQIQLADMDRHVYADPALTIARHPSEADERMMIRVLALALGWPADTSEGTLELAKDMWEPDEPALWQKNFSGEILQWVEVGQPDDKRLMKACGRADRVTVWAFQSSTPVWWNGIANKLTRASKLTVWQVPSDQSQALAAMAQRSMQLQITVQDGTVWVNDGQESVEISPIKLMGPD